MAKDHMEYAHARALSAGGGKRTPRGPQGPKDERGEGEANRNEQEKGDGHTFVFPTFYVYQYQYQPCATSPPACAHARAHAPSTDVLPDRIHDAMFHAMETDAPSNHDRRTNKAGRRVKLRIKK